MDVEKGHADVAVEDLTRSSSLCVRGDWALNVPIASVVRTGTRN
jgi:hypothetical protein